MRMQSVRARPPLSAHVEMFWGQQARERLPGPESVLPSGTIDVVVDLLDPARPPLVCGPHTTPFRMQRARRESYVGIHFKPGGAAAILGVPAHELRGRLLELDALWGQPALELRDRLQEAGTFAARVSLLEETLCARLERARDPHPAVTYALAELGRAPANTSIATLGACAGLSARRFIELFEARVGLTPKLFARLRRFQTVLDAATAREGMDWADVALRCGYYDQAHLHRDFRAFADLTPGAYLRQRSADPHHVPLAEP